MPRLCACALYRRWQTLQYFESKMFWFFSASSDSSMLCLGEDHRHETACEKNWPFSFFHHWRLGAFRTLLLVPVTGHCSWKLFLTIVPSWSYSWSRELFLTAGPDSCSWQLVLTAGPDSCFWQLFLTAVSDSWSWQLFLTAGPDSWSWQLFLTAGPDSWSWQLEIVGNAIFTTLFFGLIRYKTVLCCIAAKRKFIIKNYPY